MSERPDVGAAARRWMEKADQDLAAARHLLALDAQGLSDIVCYHCQQCAEKYLKSLLVLRGVSFPKTHDLRRLLEIVQERDAPALTPEQVLPLNRYVIEGRYPGGWEPIDAQEAAEAVEMAGSVRAAVRAVMPADIVEKDGEN